MSGYQKQLALTLLGYAVQRDLSPEQLCRLSNIDYHSLRSPEGLPLTLQQFNALWINVCHLSQDPFFGLHLGESMQLAALGIVGELIKSSRTVGEGVKHASAFTQLLTNMFIMDVRPSKKNFVIHLEANEALKKAFPETFQQMMDLTLVMTIHELDGLILRKILPVTVHIPFRDDQLQEYTRTLRCVPTRSNEYKVEFDGAIWDEPIITVNYELQGILRKQASDRMASSVHRPAVTERINQYLIAHAYLGIPTLEEIAANFNVSPRTLQRKLNDEGSTYQQLSDGVRKSLALTYLTAGTYQAKEISVMLGYNELSAFTRAFKRWTGKTPGKYQKVN